VIDGISVTRTSTSTTSVAVPGATLACRVVGPEEGEVLLVVHGGPGESHDVLRPHLDALASSARRIVYYDQRGGGRSPLARDSAPGDWRRHVEDLDAVRGHFTAGPVDVLGFSWGALLTVLYALEHREDVARLVLVSPPPLHAGFGGERIRRDVEAARARPEVRAVEERARELASGSGDAATRARAQFVARVAPLLADPDRAWDLTPVDARDDVARAVWDSLGTYDLRPRLETLRGVPILVVGGTRDAATSSTIADTAGLLGAEPAVLAECGHAPFFESADAFRATVEAFLGAHATRLA